MNNRLLTSVIAIGAGIAAYNMARRNNMFNGKTMRKMQKRVTKALF